jgi:ABC-type lipoprotein export system ATPase subunit
MTDPIPPSLRADSLVHRRSPPAELRGVSLAIQAGGFTLLSGDAESGAGLLLRILGLLERPDSGEVWFDSIPMGPVDDVVRLGIRNHQFAFLFAEPFLLDSFTVAENVAMPLFKISGFDIERARARTAEVLDFAGIEDSADFAVADLPPLDQHKISLARALAVAPRVLIAEDPGLQLATAELREFAALLRTVPERLGISIIATSPAGAEVLGAGREIRLERGVIVADSQPVEVEEAPAHD